MGIVSESNMFQVAIDQNMKMYANHRSVALKPNKL